LGVMMALGLKSNGLFVVFGYRFFWGFLLIRIAEK